MIPSAVEVKVPAASVIHCTPSSIYRLPCMLSRAATNPSRAKRLPEVTRRSKNQPVLVDGVKITHPDKIWWPEENITKLDVVKFYADIAPHILPWLRDRLLTAERCTQGMRGPCFFQKNFEKGLPPGTPTFALRAETTGKDVHYVVGGDKKTLLALVNLGCIAIHVMNCRTRSLHSADWLAFDLDPSSEKFGDAVKAAQVLASILAEFKLVSFPKTSGGRGLHIFVPLRAGYTQDEVREFALKVGYLAAERAPALITMEMSKAARHGRVLMDAMRNGFAQTVVPPYSVRRRPKAPVSTPLAWDEVDPKLDPTTFNIRKFERRLIQQNPWADFWKTKQVLPR
jgi:bifunctional non-homologous end joining protein LigD